MESRIWWKDEDSYTTDEAIPQTFVEHSGPKGVALVRAWDDGTTDKGWGLARPDKPKNPGFMELYTNEKFAPKRTLLGYGRGAWSFAFVMRSMRIVCVDIDGKNGGLENAIRLGPLPHTLAEKSKSGNGFHLFYSVPEDVWDDDMGFALYADRIGIEQGVDIRATGCVYHVSSQRWNDKEIAELPTQLATRLTKTANKIKARAEQITKTLSSDDDHEVLMMKQELIDDLYRPIPAGRRNNTLFALGSQMKLADVENWEDMVFKRAVDVGLSGDEATKLVHNINSYA